MRQTAKSYDRLAWVYDGAASLYSGGQIAALKTSQLSELQTGDRVLYAGVGSGEDAVLAAGRRVVLTVLDSSPLMLERAARLFREAGLEGDIEIVCSDVLSYRGPDFYDVVVVNFFLNIFSETDMVGVLTHLSAMLRPGGRMLIGDFSYPKGTLTARLIQRVYYLLSMFSFWLVGGTTLHPIYDYPRYFEAARLRTLRVQRFRVNATLPASFDAITAEKL